MKFLKTKKKIKLGKRIFKKQSIWENVCLGKDLRRLSQMCVFISCHGFSPVYMYFGYFLRNKTISIY